MAGKSNSKQKTTGAGEAVAVGAGLTAGAGAFSVLSGKAAEWVKKGTEEASKAVQNAYQGYENGPVEIPIMDGNEVVNPISEEISNNAEQLVSETVENLENVANEVGETIKEVGQQASEAVKEGAEKVGEVAKEVAKESGNFFGGIADAVKGKMSEFGELGFGKKALVVAGSAAVAFVTYKAVEALMPKTETKAGTMEHQGQVQQQARGMHAAPA